MDRLALFDLDRTLLSCNSAFGWVRREFRSGRMPPGQVLRSLGWLIRYHLGETGMEEALRQAASSLAGESEALQRERTAAYWRESLHSKLRSGGSETVEAHRKAGDALAIITGSSVYLAELAAESLGIEHVLANRFQVEEGVFTGGIEEPMCYGQGKAELAEGLLRRLGISFQSCVFYTDSYTDVPLLRLVGRPVAVHPDRRLFAEAKRCGWEVENWL